MRRLVSSAAVLVMLSACSGPSSTPWQTQDQLYAVDGQTWVVGSHLVMVALDAAQAIRPSVGSTVRVSGQRTARGELVIDTVEVLTTPAAQVPTAPAAQVPAPTPRPAQNVTTTAPRAPAPKKKPGRGDD